MNPRRHPDIIQLLCTQVAGFDLSHVVAKHRPQQKALLLEAQCLLKTLLDGMMWHSHLTTAGMRRTNYYIKHLITDRHQDQVNHCNHFARLPSTLMQRLACRGNGDFAPCMKAIVQLQDSTS